MKKYIFALLLCVGFALPALGQSTPPTTWQEADGSPKVTPPKTIIVPNGSISGKTVTLTGGGGSGCTPPGTANRVLYDNGAGGCTSAAGFTFNGSGTISLGVAGSSVGAIGFRNATSGTITLQPVTGALGTVTLSLPAVTDTLVGLAATQTLTNKTLTAPVIAQISNTGTLTLPTSTDTLVGRATTDTLTNKTLSTSNTVSAALTWTAGVKQTFAPNGTSAGINVGSVAGDPSAPANGDLWYDSTANELTARINGANVALGAGGGGSPGGSSGQFQFNSAGSFGGTTGVSYASSGAPTVSITGQSTTQLTSYFLGPNTSSNAITAIQLGTGGSSGNFVEYRNSSGTALSVVDSTGAGGFGVTSSLGARVHAVGGGSGNAGRFDGATLSTNTVLVARQGSSSTGNLFETQTSGGTVQTSIDNSGVITENRPGIGVTSTDGIVLQNTTAAAAGAQQYSPRLRLTGQGWKTNATAASQTVDWIFENQPVQASAAPTSTLAIRSQVNGGGYSNNLQITSGNLFTFGNTSVQAVGINAIGTGNFSSGFTQFGNLNNNAMFAMVYPSGVWAMEMGSGYGVKGHIGLIASTTDALEIGSGMGSSSPFNLTKSYLKFDTSNVRLQTDTPFVIGASGSIGTSGTNVLAIFNGTAPSSSPADEFQLYSADSAAGDANAFARNEAGEINRLTGLSARVSTQFDKTSDTTLANVTGLSRNVEAGRTYAFTAVLYTTSNVAGGVKAAIGGTATATSIIYQAEVLDGSTLATVGTARATSLATTVGDVTAVTAARITISGTIVVNAAGTLTVQFAQNASNGTASSVLVNSSFQLIPIS